MATPCEVRLETEDAALAEVVARVAEAEAGGDELDLGAGARERGGELVVVLRRERGRIGEGDAHRQ